MKTISLKKVAVVAVASLGFGLTSVVPAQAAGDAALSAVFNTTLTTTTTLTNVAVGAVATVPLTVTYSAGVAAETGILTCVTTTRPANAEGVTTTAANPTTFTGYVVGTNSLAPTGGANVATVVNTTAIGVTTNTFTANYTPNVPGIYVITCTLTGTGVGTVKPTGSLTHVWTISAGFQAIGGTTNINKAFPLSGSNITTGWSATAGGQPTLRVSNLTQATEFFVTVSGGSLVSCVGSDNTATTGTVAFTNGVNLAGGCKFTTTTNTPSASMDIRVTDTGSAASSTITVASITALTAVSTTFVAATVTYGVAATPSAQFSLVTLNAEGTAPTTATGAAADTTATIVSRTASTTPKFRIQVVVKDQYDVANVATIGASIAGPGNLGIVNSNAGATTNPAGRSLTVTSGAGGVGSVSVYSDGEAGTGVITITATNALGVSIVLATKTVKFAGPATKATATQNLFVASAGTALGLPTPTTTVAAATTFLTTPAFSVELTDAKGFAPIAGSTVKMTSSDTSVIVVGTCAELTAGTAAQIAIGTFECSVSGATNAVSGKTATVTFSVFTASTGLFDVLATPITFTIGGAIAKVVVSADKTAYDAGGAMNLTATATDSSGNKAADGQAPYASISSNKTLITLPATTKFIVNGSTSTTSSKGVASLFAPATVGSFTITGLSAATVAAPLGTAYAVTASVNDGNAAIAASISALNAKIVALNALIAKIMKRLNIR